MDNSADTVIKINVADPGGPDSFVGNIVSKFRDASNSDTRGLATIPRLRTTGTLSSGNYCISES